MSPKILSAGLAAAFLPGTCTTLDGIVGPGRQAPLLSMAVPADEASPFKSLQLFMQAADPPPEDEPVDPPDGVEDST